MVYQAEGDFPLNCVGETVSGNCPPFSEGYPVLYQFMLVYSDD